MAARINIAIPNYGSQMRSEFVHSLYPLLTGPLAPHWSFSFSDIDYADIVASRNYLISNFYYNKPDCSHMLMIDNDMGFSAGLIGDMFALQKPVVGAIYPKRGIDLAKLHSLGHLPFEKAYAASLDFVGRLYEPQTRSNGFVRMESCGAGVLLVSRDCVDRMVAVMPELVDEVIYKTQVFASRLPRFITPFDKMRDAAGEYSEDIAFCRRWTIGCGGEIWASYAHRISHAGSLTVRAAFGDL